jgi:DNA-binding beta-propeller fold protein YncE
MKTLPLVCLAAAALILGTPQLSTAQAAKFRFVAALYADSQGTGLNLPEGVACSAGGQVVIADTANNRLVRFTYTDKAFNGGTEIKIPQLTAPARVQINSKGEIYALDSTQRRIVHLGSDGAFKETLSFDGTPGPSTIVPKGFAIDSADSLYVLDVFSSRVLVLNPQGQFQKALPLPEDAGFISDVAVDFAGNVIVIDALKRRMYSAAKDASAFTPLGGDLTQYIATMPAYLTSSKGTIYIVEGEGSHIVNIGRDGSFLTRQLTMGWNEGSLQNPSQICINDKDEVFIADRDNSRIQVFQLIR